MTDAKTFEARLVDCVCGDMFADEDDFPREVHLWSCPVRVRQGSHRPSDDCLAIDPAVWATVMQLVRDYAPDDVIHDTMLRPIR